MMERNSLIDSTNDIKNYKKLRSRLKRDGYLLIRNFISFKEANSLKNEININLWGSSNKAFTGAVDQDPRYGSNYSKAYSLECIHKLWHKKKIINFFKNIFDSKVFMHPKIVLRNSYKNTFTPAHQDWPQVQGSKNTLGIWIALNEVKKSSGVLEIAESSHKSGIRNHIPNKITGGLSLNDKKFKWLSTEMQPGDAIIFTCLTVHKTSKNKSDIVRQSLDARFQPLNESICKESLEPFIQESWKNIYSNWKEKKLFWYWKDYNLTLEKFDDYFEIINSLQIIEKYNNNKKVWKPALKRVTTRVSSSYLKNKAKDILNEKI